MFTGLSAFPLTPFIADGTADEAAFVRLVERLADAGVDSIGALGSTGSYAYLRPADRVPADPSRCRACRRRSGDGRRGCTCDA